MSKDEPIYVDASQPADLRHGTTHPVTTAFLTLQEAKIAFNHLSEVEKQGATIVVRNPYRVFKPSEIERLHKAPGPDISD